MRSTRWRHQRIALVGGEALGLGKTQFLAHHISAQHQGDRFVEGVTAAHTFAAHATIGRDNEPLGRNVFECNADLRRHLIRGFNLKDVMIDDANCDLLVRNSLADRFQVRTAGT